MHSPIIGLTTYKQKNIYGYPIAAVMQKYISVISEAGGVALLIPNEVCINNIREILKKIDGILFTGGGDIAPKKETNNDIHQFIDVDEERDFTEYALLMEIIKKQKPFLGICRGVQLINVVLGGSLYHHIPEDFPGAKKHNYNSGTERELLAHEIKILEKTHLSEIFKMNRLSVNSLHHQGIRNLASCLTAAAIAPDGLIEAVELTDYIFGIAVQWHPEWLTTQEAQMNLFRAFINAAREHSISERD